MMKYQHLELIYQIISNTKTAIPGLHHQMHAVEDRSNLNGQILLFLMMMNMCLVSRYRAAVIMYITRQTLQ
jgi:hypothetical protein